MLLKKKFLIIMVLALALGVAWIKIDIILSVVSNLYINQYIDSTSDDLVMSKITLTKQEAHSYKKLVLLARDINIRDIKLQEDVLKIKSLKVSFNLANILTLKPLCDIIEAEDLQVNLDGIFDGSVDDVDVYQKITLLKSRIKLLLHTDITLSNLLIVKQVGNSRVATLLHEIRSKPQGGFAQISFANNKEMITNIKIFEPNSEFLVRANFALDNIKTENLMALWPDNVSANVRTWLEERMHNGRIISTKGDINLSIKDLVGSGASRDSVKITTFVEKISLQYYNDFPQLEEIKAELRFAGDGVDIFLEKAKAQGVSILPSIVHIDFNKSMLDGKFKVRMPVSGLRYYAPEGSFLENFARVKGEALLDGDLAINLDNPEPKVRIIAKISKASYASLAVTNSSLQFLYENEAISARMSGKLNNENYQLDLIHQDKLGTQFKINTVVTSKNYKLYNIPLGFKVDSGSMPVEVEYQNGKLLGKMRMQNAVMGFDELSFYKPKTNKDALMIEGDLNQYQVPIKISTTGKDIKIIGDLYIDTDNWQVVKVNLSKFQMGENNFALTYFEKNKQKYVKLTGESLDFSKLDFENLNNTPSKSEHVTLQLKINKAKMKNEQVFSGVEADVSCDGIFRCNTVNITGSHSSGKKFSVIKDGDIIVSAEDGSSFLKGLDIYNKIEGGKLCGIITQGEFLDYHQVLRPKLLGRFYMTNFKITKTSFLTKLMIALTTLTEITKLGDSYLIGNRVDLDLEYFNNNLIFNKMRLSSPGIELTLRGYVDLGGKKVSVVGEVIPLLWGINKFLGNMPLVKYLISDRNAEAVIAANYSLYGDYQRPIMVVNPISIFIPGIFKGALFSNGQGQ